MNVMNEIIFVVQESQEGGYEARALGYAVFTQAETSEKLKANVRDAVRCHFEETEMPKIILCTFTKAVGWYRHRTPHRGSQSESGG